MGSSLAMDYKVLRNYDRDSTLTRTSKKKKKKSVMKTSGFPVFVRISLPVRSLRKTECVESLSAGKQHAHSETRREGFSLQKMLLEWIRKTKMLAKPVSPCCGSLLHRMNLMWSTNLKLFLKSTCHCSVTGLKNTFQKIWRSLGRSEPHSRLTPQYEFTSANEPILLICRVTRI